MTRMTVAVFSSVLFVSAHAFAQVAAPPAPPPLRMAFVDLQRVAAESAEGKVANSKVQALGQAKSNEIATKTKQLETAQQKIQQGGAVLNEATRVQLQREVDRLTVEIDRLQQDAQAEVQEFQQQQLGDFQEKLRPVVDELIKELGVGLLFSSGESGAIYIDTSLDITPEVIKRMDAAAKTGAATKPAAPATAKPAIPPAPKPTAPAAPAAPGK